jgi:metal-sulfur cluster biosynthetic enzyme
MVHGEPVTGHCRRCPDHDAVIASEWDRDGDHSAMFGEHDCAKGSPYGASHRSPYYWLHGLLRLSRDPYTPFCLWSQPCRRNCTGCWSVFIGTTAHHPWISDLCDRGKVEDEKWQMRFLAPVLKKTILKNPKLSIIDPETGADVVRMKLIENLVVDESGLVSYTFRPSSPLCPIAVYLAVQVKMAVASVPGVSAQKIVSDKLRSSRRTDRVDQSGVLIMQIDTKEMPLKGKRIGVFGKGGAGKVR